MVFYFRFIKILILFVTKNILLNPSSDLSLASSLALLLIKFLLVASKIFFFGTNKPKKTFSLPFSLKNCKGPEDNWCSLDLKMES